MREPMPTTAGGHRTAAMSRATVAPATAVATSGAGKAVEAVGSSGSMDQMARVATAIEITTTTAGATIVSTTASESDRVGTTIATAIVSESAMSACAPARIRTRAGRAPGTPGGAVAARAVGGAEASDAIRDVHVETRLFRPPAARCTRGAPPERTQLLIGPPRRQIPWPP